MKALNWFQARSLAKLQRRAIRQEADRHWLLWRGNLFLISELDTDGNERRLVVPASRFRDSQYMAKDWTDEPWQGGWTPPCTTVPASTVLAGNDSRGTGTWTNDPARCAGDGNAGGAPGRIVDPFEEVITDVEVAIRPFALTTGRPLLAPDGTTGTCWHTPPATYGVAIIYRLGPQVPKRTDAVFEVWFSATGQSLAGNVPAAFSHYVRQMPLLSGQGYGVPASWAGEWETYDGRFVIDPASNATVALAFPGGGATITARVDYITPEGRVTAMASYEFAPDCYP